MKLNLGRTAFGFNRTVQVVVVLLLMISAEAFSVTVSSISELKEYLDDDSVHVVMTPGTYTVTAADGAYDVVIGGTTRKVLLYFEGSNSTYDFTDVTINVKTTVAQSHGSYDIYEINICGNNNVLKNLTLVDDGGVDDAPTKRATNIVIDGRENRLEGFHMTTKGSYPYGYGDAFGKGGGPVIAHHKRSALLVRGESNHVLNCTLIHRSYGHGIFTQAAVNPLIEGCYVEGEMRTTDDMLAEEGTGSPADNVDFMTVWGWRLEPGHIMSLGEAGVRAYNAGITIIDGVEYSRSTSNITVKDCTIKHMRKGVGLHQSKGTETISGCTVIGCETAYDWDGNNFSNNIADVSYGPAFGAEGGQTVDITITQNFPTYNGGNCLAYISGSGNNITLNSSASPVDTDIKVIFGGDRDGLRFIENYTPLSASNSVINNYTAYPVLLSNLSSRITGQSAARVIDIGTNNNVVRIDSVSGTLIEAEDFSDMLGITTEATSDVSGVEHITEIDSADWLEYDVNIPVDGSYFFDYRVQAGPNGGTFELSVGDSVIDKVQFEETQGWDTIRSAEVFNLIAGLNTIRLTSMDTAWNLNWLKLSLDNMECFATPIEFEYTAYNDGLIAQDEGSGDSVSVFANITLGLMATSIVDNGVYAKGTWSWTGPGNFTSSSQEALLKNIQSNQGGMYYLQFTRTCGSQSMDSVFVIVEDSVLIEAENYMLMSGITTENTADLGGGEQLTDIDEDDWVIYQIEVPYTGKYYINLRVASEASEVTVGITDTLDVELGEITFASTGGYENWQTVRSSLPILLEAGTQYLKIISGNSGWKMNWLSLGLQEVVIPCTTEMEFDDHKITNGIYDWVSGAIDITCYKKMLVELNIEGIGTLNDTDSLKIYYKLDDGAWESVTERNGAVEWEQISIDYLVGDELQIMIQGCTESDAQYYLVSDILFSELSNLRVIEAESYDSMYGVETEDCSEETLNLSYVENDDWTLYKNLDLTNVGGIKVRASSKKSGGTIEVHLNSKTGQLIGEVEVTNTSGWQSWQTFEADLRTDAGIYDVYMVYTGGSGYLLNFNWFQFVEGENIISSIDETSMDTSNILFYPNPVGQTLSYSNFTGESGNLQIFNSAGTKVLSTLINVYNSEIDVSGLNPGLYVLRFHSENQVQIQKMIKK